MKFFLSVTNHELKGYKLISPLKGQNPTKINEFIDDGEATEIIAERILEYVPAEEVMNYVSLLAKKLAHKGQLIITSTDIVILSEKFIRGEINIIDFNKILFGSKTHAWDFKMSAVSLGDINEVATVLNLKVLEKNIDDFTFTIRLERP